MAPPGEAEDVIQNSARSAAPRPTLSVFDAVMITVGIVIGAGIFQTPAMVAQFAGDPTRMLALWIAGGVLTMIGALCYAELASTYPNAGGDYGFLTRAYGRSVSFMFAWARSTVIVTGSIALLAFILGEALARVANLGPLSSAFYAVLAVLVLTAINLAGLRTSSRLQNLLGVVEIGGVLLIAALGFLAETSAVTHPHEHQTASADSGALGLAMVFVLLAYGGWNEAAYVSAEVRGGGRAVLRTLVLSIAIISAVYIAFVAGALHALGFAELAASPSVGVDVARNALGDFGAQLIAMLVAVAALTSMNSTMLVGARTNYALASDWRALRVFSGWRDDRNTPVAGFIVQSVIAIALIIFGAVEKNGFATMVEFTAPVFWFFFLLSGVALFVLRTKDPSTPRVFRVPLYPLTPLIFVAMCAYLLYSSVSYARSEHAVYISILVSASGVIALGALQLRERRQGARG